jgi:hypothetical protein
MWAGFSNGRHVDQVCQHRRTLKQLEVGIVGSTQMCWGALLMKFVDGTVIVGCLCFRGLCDGSVTQFWSVYVTKELTMGSMARQRSTPTLTYCGV